MRLGSEKTKYLLLFLFFASVLAVIVPGYAQSASNISSQASLSETSHAEKAFSVGAPLPSWVEGLQPIPNESGKNPVTIRMSNVNFHVDQNTAVFIHRAIQVNEVAMLSYIGQTEIVFQADYQHVLLHVLRVHRGSQVFDKLREADIRFLRREPELDAGTYGGFVTAAIVINDLRVGDTLEIAYTTIGDNPVFGNKFFDQATWDAPYPTLKRRVILNAPENRDIQYRVIGAEKSNMPQAKISRIAGRRIVHFEQNDLAPSDYDSNMPHDYQSMRWIQFSEFSSWRQVEQWANNLFTVPAVSAVLLDELAPMKKTKSQEEAVVKTLEFVQNNIRYLSVSIGENSHRPYSPEQVLKRRYGDCKDKTLLLVTMLKQLGVEAAPALVSTYYKKNLDQMIPSPQLFDHVIVRAVVQGKVYFLDPTRLGQFGKLDRMGQTHAYKQALVITPDTDKLINIAPPSNDELITNSRIERITVKKMDEPVQMSVQLKYAGVDAEMVRDGISQLSAAQLRKFYEGNLTKRYPNALLVGEPEVQDERTENRVTITLQFQIRDFFQTTQNRWFFYYQANNLTGLFNIPSNINRKAPLVVPAFPSINRYQLEVNLPDEFDAHYSPFTSQIKDDAFTLSESSSFSGKQIDLKLEMKITADRIDAKSVATFMNNINKAGESISNSLNIRQSDLKANNVKLTSQLPFKQRVVEKLEKIVKRTTSLISDTKLTGQDPSVALCEQAKAMSYLGNVSDAANGLQKMAIQQPNSLEILRCLAEVDLANGNLISSEKKFSRAITLGLDDVSIYLQRGIANFYMRNYQAAISDFSQVLKLSKTPDEKSCASVWRAIATLRAGKPLGEENISNNDNEWFNKIVAILASREAPEALLRMAHKESGDMLETALAEAYFFLGQHYLIKGEKVKARVYFQQSLDKGVLYSQYHSAARQELIFLK